MTNEKCLEVLSFYKTHLANLDLSAGSLCDNDEVTNHLKSMLPKMKTFIEEGRREKFFRWLGFVQGVLWSHYEFNLEHLCNHNRPDKEE